jgi:hypothetical protein
MIDKSEIDRKRNQGGTAEIGSKEDGAILQMQKIGERLFVIKERSIYEFIMADDIDPDRTNIHLPNNMHKRIINQGTESEIVSRIFITAKTLFKQNLFDKKISTDQALLLSLELLQELAILQNEIQNYLQSEKKVVQEYYSKTGSYIIPSIEHLQTTCKTIFQKAYQIEQILIDLVVIFYPNEKGLNKQSHFPKLYEFIKDKYGEDDVFTQFIKSTLGLMKVLIETRNGLDHRLHTVKVENFELLPDGNLFSPSIALVYKDVKLERESLSSFLPIIEDNLISIFENLSAYLCSKKAIPGIMRFSVVEIPEDKRRNRFIKYCFWSPMGEGGYYDQ